MLKKLFGYAAGVFLLTLAFALPSRAVAYSPIISSCSNGFVGTILYLFPSANQTIKQLFEVRLDGYVLDAVGVRLEGVGTQPSKVRVLVIKRDGPVISSAIQTIQPGVAWAYVDLADANIPRGVYYLQVELADQDSSVGWAYTGNYNCIEDSFVMVNDEMNLDIDLGFGIYAYDNSSVASPVAPIETPVTSPSASPASQNNSSNSNTADNQASGSSPRPTTGSTTPVANTTTDPANLPSSDGSNVNSKTTSSGNSANPSAVAVDPSLTRMGPLAIAWFVGWGLIIFLIIWFVVKRKKKDSKQVKQGTTLEKNKPTKEESHEK